MSSAVADVILAASQSVGKVFVIGAIGYAAVQYPKNAPLLPAKAVGTIARFGFNILTISLLFSSIASSVTIDSLSEFWFVVIGAFGVFSISFATATVVSYIIPIQNQRDFMALRIAATFPNIVALPILIFPSLCEYSVVYEAFGGTGDDSYRQCVAKSNTMIFCYFFSWSFLFWSCGHPTLMKAAHMKPPPAAAEINNNNNTESEIASAPTEESNNTAIHTAENQSIDLTVPNTEHDDNASAESENNNANASSSEDNETPSMLTNFWVAIKRTFASPPFIAMLLAFTIGCISPLRNLFFSQGGALRFLGAAIETLGQASSPMSTMVVAASLVPQRDDEEEEKEPAGNNSQDAEQPPGEVHHGLDNDDDDDDMHHDLTTITHDESPIMSDPNFGPHQTITRRRRSSVQRIGKSIKRKSMQALTKVRRTPPEQRRVLLWFTLSRLVLSPLFVVLSIVGLDCGAGVLDGVPDLAKLVLIVNSSVPGALIIVVLLKSNPELYETATVVAKVYLPTYLISIVSIAAWTALGLIVSIPDENGNSFCSRF